MNAVDQIEILDFVYREWFPRRDRGRDVSFSSRQLLLEIHAIWLKVAAFHMRL